MKLILLLLLYQTEKNLQRKVTIDQLRQIQIQTLLNSYIPQKIDRCVVLLNCRRHIIQLSRPFWIWSTGSKLNVAKKARIIKFETPKRQPLLWLIFELRENVCIRRFSGLYFPHSDWTWRDTEYLSVFNPNGKNTDHKNSEYRPFSGIMNSWNSWILTIIFNLTVF